MSLSAPTAMFIFSSSSAILIELNSPSSITKSENARRCSCMHPSLVLPMNRYLNQNSKAKRTPVPRRVCPKKKNRHKSQTRTKQPNLNHSYHTHTQSITRK
ncbi:hypothetical protein SAICODRAFT_122169 [Saitoella complicata NRRL Y-17804]|nr:uncharacterized protein SAICODRAFT_122169 [Saitoella complicata NRRL Y-17804]ODQ52936.1 hypothetical protein SAICODRAFT_122169 [Saitoella complicata NRRL Y-17804]